MYDCIPVEGDVYSNPVKNLNSVNLLLENPPKIEMNGNRGLYLRAMAYEFYTGNSVDYLNIKELMETGKTEQVLNDYKGYIEWVKSNKDNINMFKNKLIKLGAPTDIYANYHDYQELIESKNFKENMAAIESEN